MCGPLGPLGPASAISLPGQAAGPRAPCGAWVSNLPCIRGSTCACEQRPSLGWEVGLRSESLSRGEGRAGRDRGQHEDIAGPGEPRRPLLRCRPQPVQGRPPHIKSMSVSHGGCESWQPHPCAPQPHPAEPPTRLLSKPGRKRQDKRNQRVNSMVCPIGREETPKMANPGYSSHSRGPVGFSRTWGVWGQERAGGAQSER